MTAGRKPKPAGQAVNRNLPTHEWREIVDVPFDGVSPDLPDDQTWSARTRKWWETVRRMPHCSLWSDSDWQDALLAATVAEVFFAEKKLANEFRFWCAILGTNDLARRDLRIRYVSALETDGDSDATVTDIDRFRRH